MGLYKFDYITLCYGVAWNQRKSRFPGLPDSNYPFRFGFLNRKADDPGSKVFSKANTGFPGSPTLIKMAEEIRHGSIKRFGARYGRKVKERFAKIELEQRRKHKCPYCNNIKVKRVASGIWQCRKCDAKFSGKAYSIKKKIIFEEETSETPRVSEHKEGKKEIKV